MHTHEHKCTHIWCRRAVQGTGICRRPPSPQGLQQRGALLALVHEALVISHRNLHERPAHSSSQDTWHIQAARTLGTFKQLGHLAHSSSQDTRHIQASGLLTHSSSWDSGAYKQPKLLHMPQYKPNRVALSMPHCTEASCCATSVLCRTALIQSGVSHVCCATLH